MKTQLLATAFALAACAIAATPASAALTRFTVEKTTPMPGGYVLLEGRFFGELDPDSVRNALINDIKLAPRNAAGRVEYSATFAIAKPEDVSRSSGMLVYDVPNRGNGAAANIGDGHVHVVGGWQGDLDEGPGVQSLRAPSVQLNGPAYVRFLDIPANTNTLTIKGGPQGKQGGRGFEVATEENAKLYTGVSDDQAGAQNEIQDRNFAFADCSQTPFPGKPDLTKLCVKDGFDPKLAYTLAFTAKNPKVLGLALPPPAISSRSCAMGSAMPPETPIRWRAGCVGRWGAVCRSRAISCAPSSIWGSTPAKMACRCSAASIPLWRCA